jgi:predicted amidohydrolase
LESSLRIAASQFPVSGNIARNARYIESQMHEAATQGVQVIQFPETSLSGYGPKHFESFNNYEWNILDNHKRKICDLASSLNLWVVLGSTRQAEPELPRNCVQVISNTGVIVGTYDKQRLYSSEKEYYSLGTEPLVIEINGFRCGFLICYDNCYPELYDVYRNREVGLLFHSFHNAGNRHVTSIKDLMLANLIVRAADYQMWISASNSSKRYSPLSACIVRPDGSMVKSRRNVAGIVIDDYPKAKLGWTYDNRKI